MKIKLSNPLIPFPMVLLFILFFPGLAFANYARMNKEIQNYTPPDFFTKFVEPKTKETHILKEIKLDLNSTGFQIQALKKVQENILDTKAVLFLSDYDPVLYKKLGDLTNNFSTDSSGIITWIGRKLVLKEIEILTALVNPGVIAAQKKVAAELLSYDQIMGLDDALKQYGGITKGITNQAGPVSMKGIGKSWPFPGLTGLKGRIIKEQVAIAVEKMNIVQREVITRARKSYWDLVYLDESQKITDETIDALNRLKDVATILYKSGRTSFQDIIKINIKVELLIQDLATLVSRRRNVEASLLELLNLPAGTRVGRVAKSPVNKEIGLPKSLYPIARKNRQELKVIGHGISKLENMIQMAELMVHEPFTLGLSTYENDAVNTGTGAPRTAFPEKTMAAMKNNQPKKSWYGQDEPWLNQTRQNLSSLKQTRTKEEKTTDRMVHGAWFMVDKNRRELSLYEKKILPLSKAALDVSDREYESGSIPFSQAIDSYTFWLGVKLTIARKKSGLGSSIAALERVMGKSL